MSEYAYPHSLCRSCDAPVIWCMTEGGKRMPVDAEPTPDGILELRPGNPPLAVVTGNATLFDHGLTPTHYSSHFQTCPEADSWRKR